MLLTSLRGLHISLRHPIIVLSRQFSKPTSICRINLHRIMYASESTYFCLIPLTNQNIFLFYSNSLSLVFISLIFQIFFFMSHPLPVIKHFQRCRVFNYCERPLFLVWLSFCVGALFEIGESRLNGALKTIAGGCPVRQQTQMMVITHVLNLLLHAFSKKIIPVNIRSINRIMTFSLDSEILLLIVEH